VQHALRGQPRARALRPLPLGHLADRRGPNWFKEVNGTRLRCGGQGVAAETDSCNLKDTNQYLLDVMHPGKYVACGGTGSPGTCGHCILDEDDFGVIHNSPAGPLPHRGHADEVGR
jgi:hypothetical protein